jgi:hypothetical protein
MDDKLTFNVVHETDTEYTVCITSPEGKQVNILIPKDSPGLHLWSVGAGAKPFGLNMVTSGHYI